MKSFNVVHHDGVIKVQITNEGHAVLDVEAVTDNE